MKSKLLAFFVLLACTKQNFDDIRVPTVLKEYSDKEEQKKVESKNPKREKIIVNQEK